MNGEKAEDEIGGLIGGGPAIERGAQCTNGWREEQAGALN